MGSIRRVLEIAASTQVLRERQRAAVRATASRTSLGRTILTLRGLAERCADETCEHGEPPLRGGLDGAAVTRVVHHAAARSARLGALLAERPGLAGALGSTVRDLRDAGIPPAALPDAAADVRDVLRATEDALDALAREGLVDRIGLFRRAARGAPHWARRLGFASIEVHGATELVGSAGDLVDALTEAAPVRMFQPDWGGDFAREVRASWPWRFDPEPVEVIDDPALPPEGLPPPGVLRSFALPTPREEIEHVAREIVRLGEAGADPSQICVVARHVDTYAPWIESVFARLGIPFAAFQPEPALREPAVRDARDWIEAVLRGLGCDAVLRLAESPRFGGAAPTRGKADGNAAETSRACGSLARWLARRAPVIRGAADWNSALDAAQRLAGEDRRPLDASAHAALRALVRRLGHRRHRAIEAPGFATVAEILLEELDRVLLRSDDDDRLRAAALHAAREAIAGVATWDRVDAVCGASGAPREDELATAFDAALRGATRRASASEGAGVRVLDALQARAIPVDHLFLVGLHHGAWPREHREDVFLPDAIRAQLRERTGRPVPLARLAEREESFLLGLLLSQARASVTLTRPRRDAEGRELAPSAFLRSLPFLAHGAAIEDVPTPRGMPEFLAAPEALVSVASRNPPDRPAPILDLVREIAPAGEPLLRAGLELLAATEADTSDSLAYDGGVGPVREGTPMTGLSPSGVAQLRTCPWRAFLRTRLRVDEGREVPPHALAANESGSLLHTVLASLYRELHEAGALAPGSAPERALGRARALLPATIAACASAVRPRLATLHPRVWDAIAARTERAARDFLERDLPRLLPLGVSEMWVEEDLEAHLATRAGALDIRGRADRIVCTPDGAIQVGDYKTTADPGRELKPNSLARGETMQIPLYVLAAGQRFGTDRVTGEILAVPVRPERDRGGKRASIPRVDHAKASRDLETPLEVLAELWHDGRFPLRPGEHCTHCPYAIACRQGHGPSQDRVRQASAVRRYFELVGEAEDEEDSA